MKIALPVAAPSLLAAAGGFPAPRALAMAVRVGKAIVGLDYLLSRVANLDIPPVNGIHTKLKDE